MPNPGSPTVSEGVRSVVDASFARVVAVIPVRDLETAKSRLGEALDPEERQELVLRLLDRTVRASLDARSVAAVLVVSPDRDLLARSAAAGADVLRQRRPGLNAGLEEARDWVASGGGTAVLVLPADLPAVTPELVDAIVDGGRAAASEPEADSGRDVALVVIVPDRHGDGTNAILLVPPAAIPFAFGPGSRRRHASLARARGARLVELASALSLDLDLPDDLLLAESDPGLEVSV